MPLDLAERIDRARGHRHAPDAPPGAPKRRIVARIDRPDVKRLDALRSVFGDATRAAIIRAFIAMGLDMAEARIKATTGEAAVSRTNVDLIRASPRTPPPTLPSPRA